MRVATVRNLCPEISFPDPKRRRGESGPVMENRLPGELDLQLLLQPVHHVASVFAASVSQSREEADLQPLSSETPPPANQSAAAPVPGGFSLFVCFGGGGGGWGGC